MMKRWFLLSMAVLITANCSHTNGFSFYPVNTSNFNLVQQKFFTPTKFQRFKSPILFDEHQTLWMAYQPEDQDLKNPYAISLSKKSLGWIEMDLKNQMLNPNTKTLIDKMENLEPGKYLLRVALNNEILDRIEFEVLSSTLQSDDYINYDAPLEAVLQENEDDIKMNSDH